MLEVPKPHWVPSLHLALTVLATLVLLAAIHAVLSPLLSAKKGLQTPVQLEKATATSPPTPASKPRRSWLPLAHDRGRPFPSPSRFPSRSHPRRRPHPRSRTRQIFRRPAFAAPRLLPAAPTTLAPDIAPARRQWSLCVAVRPLNQREA
ncbi:hypothetical protein C8J57DRAFT_1492044 [Mycena rebaudengoi]|nr:hypothetical protein C8J57DRAFT_1492044 [Mycena rebaudengoi]